MNIWPLVFIGTVALIVLLLLCRIALVAREDYDELLLDALERSVRMQSWYASTLNAYDGGERQLFENANEWICHLRRSVRFFGIKRRKTEDRTMNFDYEEVWAGLEKVVRMYSLQLQILNAYDGGNRLQFRNAAEWLEYLDKNYVPYPVNATKREDR